jgi:hypothetical protein
MYLLTFGTCKTEKSMYLQKFGTCKI